MIPMTMSSCWNSFCAFYAYKHSLAPALENELIINNNNIIYRNAPVRQHLKNVYGCLSLSTVSAAAGAYVHMYTQLLQANLLTTIGTLGLLIALMTTPDNGKNQKLRLGYLLGFAFLSGLGLGPLLELVVSIDPSIVMTALIGKSIALIYYPFYAIDLR